MVPISGYFDGKEDDNWGLGVPVQAREESGELR